MLNLSVLGVAAAGLFLVGAAGDKSTPSSSQRPVADPNQKVCQDITMIGTRLGKKRICATRAEWEQKRRDDREATERAQTQLCSPTTTSGQCSQGN